MASSSGSSAVPSSELMNDRSIFQFVDGQLSQPGQTGVAGAKVVDGQLDAQGLQAVQLDKAVAFEVGERVLRDLQG